MSKTTGSSKNPQAHKLTPFVSGSNFSLSSIKGFSCSIRYVFVFFVTFALSLSFALSFDCSSISVSLSQAYIKRPSAQVITIVAPYCEFSQTTMTRMTTTTTTDTIYDTRKVKFCQIRNEHLDIFL